MIVCAACGVTRHAADIAAHAANECALERASANVKQAMRAFVVPPSIITTAPTPQLNAKAIRGPPSPSAKRITGPSPVAVKEEATAITTPTNVEKLPPPAIEDAASLLQYKKAVPVSAAQSLHTPPGVVPGSPIKHKAQDLPSVRSDAGRQGPLKPDKQTLEMMRARVLARKAGAPASPTAAGLKTAQISSMVETQSADVKPDAKLALHVDSRSIASESGGDAVSLTEVSDLAQGDDMRSISPIRRKMMMEQAAKHVGGPVINLPIPASSVIASPREEEIAAAVALHVRKGPRAPPTVATIAEAKSPEAATADALEEELDALSEPKPKPKVSSGAESKSSGRRPRRVEDKSPSPTRKRQAMKPPTTRPPPKK